MGRPLPAKFAAAGVIPLSPPVVIHALEAVQVIQDLEHSVPLIAGKTTVVRAYVAASGARAGVSVRGELRVVNGAGVGLRVPSMQAVSADPLPGGTVQPLREDIDLSLNFLLPAEATVIGDASFELAILTRDSDSMPVAADPVMANVKFIPAPPLRVKLFGVRYRTSNTSPWFEPAEKHFRMAESWLSRAYPTNKVIVSRLVINASKNWPLRCEDVNLQLMGVRRQDMAVGGDPRTHYFGLVDDRGGGNFMRGCASDVPDHPAPDTVASGPAGSADFDWDFDGSYADWYSGHELAHTFGRNHPGHCAGNSASDPAFPFPNGQISTDDGRFVGLDVGDLAMALPMRALPGQSWKDVMTYCEKQWVSAYTFEGILTRLQAESALGAVLPTPAPFAGFQSLPMVPETAARISSSKLGHLLAKVELDDSGAALTGQIYSFSALANGSPSREFANSPACVEFLKADKTVMVRRYLRIKVGTCCEGDGHHFGIIDAALAIPEGAASLQLVLNGHSVDRRDVARTPEGIEQFRPLLAAADVEAAAAEDEGAQCTVQTSCDGGQTWETIAVNARPGQWELLRRNYPGLSSVLVRFISSTGIMSNSLVSEVALK